MSRFAFVAAERGNHAVARLCRAIGASVSGFHAWLRAIPAARIRAEAEAELRGHIGRIFAARRQVYVSLPRRRRRVAKVDLFQPGGDRCPGLRADGQGRMTHLTTPSTSAGQAHTARHGSTPSCAARGGGTPADGSRG